MLSRGVVIWGTVGESQLGWRYDLNKLGEIFKLNEGTPEILTDRGAPPTAVGAISTVLRVGLVGLVGMVGMVSSLKSKDLVYKRERVNKTSDSLRTSS